jgi:tetratricopeptide (TPR) repeat protein
MRGVGKALAAVAGLQVLLLAPCSAQSPAAGDVAGTLARLSIDLAATVTAAESVRGPLEQLTREKCDQDAILHLGSALDTAGYRRESAIAQVNFSSQCGGYAPALRGAINTLLKLSDYTTAETIAADLIRLEPFSDNGYFLCAVARDGNKSFKGAIDDYVTAIELFGNKDRISSVGYYRMARDYEKLGQFCDAMLPLQRWVALDPSRHDTSQVQAMLSDYAAKGGCAAATSGGEERFPAARPGVVVKVPVVVNNVPAIFILDTGAAFVSLKDSFAKKAKVERAGLNRAPSHRQRHCRRPTRPRQYHPVTLAQGHERAGRGRGRQRRDLWRRGRRPFGFELPVPLQRDNRRAHGAHCPEQATVIGAQASQGV